MLSQHDEIESHMVIFDQLLFLDLPLRSWQLIAINAG